MTSKQLLQTNLLFYLLGTILANDQQSRIIGGTAARKGEFPYQVSLQLYGQHYCGGSILSLTKILTAAHCVYNQPLAQMTVVAGINNLGETGQRSRVSRATYHASFSIQTLVNDVAVIWLSSNFLYSGLVQTVSLRTTLVQPFELLTVSGWGYTTNPGTVSNSLQAVKVRSIDYATCTLRIAAYPNPTFPVSVSNVCTSSPKGQGACSGDSGGPLVDTNGKQVGIVSWGVGCASGYPDVYTSISYYYTWINSH